DPMRTSEQRPDALPDERRLEEAADEDDRRTVRAPVAVGGERAVGADEAAVPEPLHGHVRVARHRVEDNRGEREENDDGEDDRHRPAEDPRYESQSAILRPTASPRSSCRKCPAPASGGSSSARGRSSAIVSAAPREKIGSPSLNSTSAGRSNVRNCSRTASIAAADGWSELVATSSGKATTPARDSGTGNGAS